MVDFMDSLKMAQMLKDIGAMSEAGISSMVKKAMGDHGIDLRFPIMTDIDSKVPGDDKPPQATPMRTITERELRSLEEERDRLRKENDFLAHKNRDYSYEARVAKTSLEETKRQLEAIKRENDEFRRKYLGRHVAPPSFVMEHLKFFIFACHPDRNPGRGEALEVTKELLKLRGE
jgi:hypothetical protein